MNLAADPFVAVPSFRRTSRAQAERRLWIAVAISVAIHALVLFAYQRGVLVRESTTPYGQGAQVLQAVLEQPKALPEVVVPLLTTVEASDAPKLPAAPPPTPEVAAPAPSGPSDAAPTAGASTALGTRDPPLSVTVGAVNDPGKYGERYAKTLADVFPDPVMRQPQLRSSLVVVYPRDAVDTRTRARIVAILTVDATGDIVDRKLIPEDPVFAPTVTEALKEARFVPAEWDGKPVRYWAILEFVFSIEGAQREVSPALPGGPAASAKARAGAAKNPVRR
jgi:protein TonB